MIEEKSKIFVLNDKQEVLTFTFFRINYVPKIILPSLEMPFLRNIDINDLEYITTIEFTEKHMEHINNHLKNVILTKRRIYYATTYECLENYRKEILRFCEMGNYLVDFMSIAKLEEILNYINREYLLDIKEVRYTFQNALEESLPILKRKLNYEEY